MDRPASEESEESGGKASKAGSKKFLVGEEELEYLKE